MRARVGSLVREFYPLRYLQYVCGTAIDLYIGRDPKGRSQIKNSNGFKMAAH
jgi:hypothetical protein